MTKAKNKKTICIFSVSYFPNVGGVEHYTHSLSTNLLRMNCNVIIVTSNTFEMESVEVIDGVKIYRMPCNKLLDGRFPVLRKNREFKALMSKLHDEIIDFIIVNTRFYRHSLFGVKFAYKNKIPHILIDHGTSHQTIGSRFWDISGQIYEHLITAIIKKYNKEFYGVSNRSLEWLKHFRIEGKGVLYNAIDLESVKDALSRSKLDFRKQYGIGANEVIVSFAGRLVYEKGIQKLINAVLNLNRDSQNVKLLIAGDGPLLDELRSTYDSSGTIMILGRIEADDVLSMFSQSDAMCLPSESEGFSTTVLEAASCKCFCISSDTGGVRELIQSRDYGIVYNPNEVENIQSAILDFINCDNRENAIDNCYSRVRNEFTWEKTTGKIIEIMHNSI